jgi:uncharacterized protein YdaU (DUF1376 family)
VSRSLQPDERPNKAPAYQWYPRDFAGDEPVQLMSLEEEGAYRRLLDHQWLHGSIPADTQPLARICKNVPVARMRKIWRAVAPCFVEAEPGRLQNRRLERVRAESREYRERQSAAGRRGAEARWGPKQPGGPGDSDPMAPLLAGDRREDGSASAAASASASASAPSVDPEAEPVAATAEGARLIKALVARPDRWAVYRFLERCPDAEQVAWAQRLSGYLEGLGFPSGMKPTPEQMATACSDYSATPPNPLHFRAFLLRLMQGGKPRTGPREPKATIDQQHDAGRRWAARGGGA